MEDVRDEMNLVCHKAIEIAFQYLGKHGEFFPFAVALLRDGDLRLIALGEDIVTSNGTENLGKLRDILRGGAKQRLYRCVATASDIRYRVEETAEMTDAVHVEVEHIVDVPISCILPYRRGENGIEQQIDPMMQPGIRTILAAEKA